MTAATVPPTASAASAEALPRTRFDGVPIALVLLHRSRGGGAGVRPVPQPA